MKYDVIVFIPLNFACPPKIINLDYNNHVCIFLYVVSRHRTLMNIFDKAPVVDKDAFVAPSASVIGDVQVGRGSSIWYGCVLRGMHAALMKLEYDLAA